MSRAANYDKCRLWFCDADHYGRGVCARHYQSFMRRKRGSSNNGYSYSPHTKELFTLLWSIKQFREVARVLSSDEQVLGPSFVDAGYPNLDARECRICHANILVDPSGKHMTSHRQDCPVRLAENMLDYTAVGPEEVLGESVEPIREPN